MTTKITLEEINGAIEDLAHTGVIRKGLFGHKAFSVLLKIKKQINESKNF